MKRAARRFFSHWQNWFALIVLLLFVAVAVAAPLLAPLEQSRPKLRGSDRFQPYPPSAEYPLGIAPGGTNVYAELVWGTRAAFRFGLVVTLLTALVGTLVGVVSAYVGGWFNGLALRVTDAFLTFPVIAAVWLFRQVMYPSVLSAMTTVPDPAPWQLFLARIHVTPLMVSLVLFSWMTYARVLNARVTQLKEAEFILAARSVGVGNARLVFRHLLPNALSPAIVLVARDIGAMVVLDATFTFIRLGGDSVWGAMLANSRDWIIGPGGNLLRYWWVFVPATLALILFGVSWNVLGDGLNVAMNPRGEVRFD